MTFNSENLQGQTIKRTICIGLGGTGKDILMRIRRLIVERYGDLKSFPTVSFVHIDTNPAEAEMVGLPGLTDAKIYRGVDLSFDISEKVSATMTATDVTNFIDGLENRTIYDREGPYDNIDRWFPRQLLRNIKAIEEGAKGIRPVGRLAFFRKYSEIQEAIQKAEQRTRKSKDELLRNKNIIVKDGLEIFIFGSLCGGTGSGIFLDVAYSLRKIYGDQGAQIVGYFVISPELYGNSSRMKANTYAALKELNYYTTPGTRFQACYDQNHMVFVDEGRPPFDYTYLVSDQTTGEYKIFNQKKLCNVIAHKIALDFSGELSSVLKGLRDNFTPYLGDFDKHPRRNIQRYLTFGLASIYFPRDIVFQISLNQIGLKLVQFWLTGDGQSPDPEQTLEQFLRQYEWHNDGETKDGLLTKLEGAVQESNKSFKQTLTVWKNNLNETISDCKTKDDREDMQRQLQRSFQDQFRTKVQPGETESVRGVWLTRLQQERPKMSQKLIKEIDDYLKYLLTPETQYFSIKSVRDWLAALTTEINNYHLSLDEKIKAFNGYKKSEDLDKLWEKQKKQLDEIEEEFAIPLIGQNRKNRNVQEKTKTIVSKVAEIIQHNFDLAVAQETIKIVRDLQSHVQNRSTQVTVLSNLLESLKSDLQQEERKVKQFNFDEMTGEAIFDNTDLDDFCNILFPSEQLRPNLELVSAKVLEDTGERESLSIFLERERVTKEQLQGKINLTVDRLFGSRSRNMVSSVIKSFMTKYSSSQQSIRLQQIINEAEPLLPLNFDGYYEKIDSKMSELIGFKEVDEKEVHQFKELLTKKVGKSENILKPTQSEEEILIVKEYAGFPLRLIKTLESLRNSYLRERNSFYTLHIDDHEPFSDIIPLPAREIEELEDLFYPCLAFNLIQKVNSQDSETHRTITNLVINFSDESTKENYSIPLSDIWEQAIENIATRPDIKQEIKKQLDCEIDKMTTQKIFEEKYLPLLEQFKQDVEKLPENDPNYPYRETVIGDKGKGKTTLAKPGIINRFIRQLRVRIEEKEKLFLLEQRNQQTLPSDIKNSEPIDAEVVENKSEVNSSNKKTKEEEKQEELNALRKKFHDHDIDKQIYLEEEKKINEKYSSKS